MLQNKGGPKLLERNSIGTAPSTLPRSSVTACSSGSSGGGSGSGGSGSSSGGDSDSKVVGW